MAITNQDPVLLTVAAKLVGAAVPSGVQRNFRAVGVHNPTAAAITLTIYLVPANGAADNSTRVINRAVLPDKTDMCPELMSRGLNADGGLWALGNGLTLGYTATDTVIG